MRVFCEVSQWLFTTQNSGQKVTIKFTIPTIIIERIRSQLIFKSIPLASQVPKMINKNDQKTAQLALRATNYRRNGYQALSVTITN